MFFFSRTHIQKCAHCINEIVIRLEILVELLVITYNRIWLTGVHLLHVDANSI